MFPQSVEDRYKHDATFTRVVDQMRQLLRMYHITPSELREASILAATMHMNENVTPLILYPGMYYSIPLFGASASNAPIRTASGSALNLEQRKSNAALDRRKNDSSFENPRKKWERRQFTYATTNRSKTGDRRKVNTHIFGPTRGELTNQYKVCTHCGLSTVYLETLSDKITCTAKP